MNVLLLFLLQMQSTPHWDYLEKSSGQTITLTYDDDIAVGELARFILYRKTGSTSTPLKLVEQQSNLFVVQMPTSSWIKEYRYYVVPVTINQFGGIVARGPASNEVLVVRKEQ